MFTEFGHFYDVSVVCKVKMTSQLDSKLKFLFAKVSPLFGIANVQNHPCQLPSCISLGVKGREKSD